MPHIHSKPGQHDLTASTFVVRTDTPEPTIVLHMHRRLNKYMHFGGHVELDENPWQTLEHELRDESGYELFELEILQPRLRIKHMSNLALHPVPIYTITVEYDTGTDHYHTDLCYALVANGPPKQPTAKGETDELKYFTYDELKELPAELIFENLKEPALFVLDEFYTKWERVPTKQFSTRTPTK